jgi:hypothetical protein
MLRDEASGVAWRVWPDAEGVPAGSVHETGSYLFELRGVPENSDAGLLIDEVMLEGLRPERGAVARWRWSPGFMPARSRRNSGCPVTHRVSLKS